MRRAAEEEDHDSDFTDDDSDDFDDFGRPFDEVTPDDDWLA